MQQYWECKHDEEGDDDGTEVWREGRGEPAILIVPGHCSLPAIAHTRAETASICEVLAYVVLLVNSVQTVVVLRNVLAMT